MSPARLLPIPGPCRAVLSHSLLGSCTPQAHSLSLVHAPCHHHVPLRLLSRYLIPGSYPLPLLCPIRGPSTLPCPSHLPTQTPILLPLFPFNVPVLGLPTPAPSQIIAPLQAPVPSHAPSLSHALICNFPGSCPSHALVPSQTPVELSPHTPRLLPHPRLLQPQALAPS